MKKVLIVVFLAIVFIAILFVPSVQTKVPNYIGNPSILTGHESPSYEYFGCGFAFGGYDHQSPIGATINLADASNVWQCGYPHL